MTKSIYLAGPGVFRQDARSYGDDLKEMCQAHGFVGLYPLDNEAPKEVRARGGRALASWIYVENLKLLHKADIVMADLSDFRGEGEPDSGTAFEVGYAAALYKPIWGYTTSTETLLQRVHTPTGTAGVLFDERGFAVENFGLPMNLMLAISSKIIYGNAGSCLIEIAAHEVAHGKR